MMVAAASAQVIKDRKIAAVDNATTGAGSANETAIAVGTDRVLTVFHVGRFASGFQTKVGYSFATLSGSTWSWSEEGRINPNAYYYFADPSVAFDPLTGNFLVAAMGRATAVSNWQMLVCRWDADTEEFGSWVELTTADESVDKPWIVLGNPPPDTNGPFQNESEFCIVWVDTGAVPDVLEYRRSRDGGETWAGGDALTDLDNPKSHVVSERGWPLPRVYGNRPLYVAHVRDFDFYCEREMRFVRGDGVGSGAHAGEVQFTELIDHATSQPISIYLNAGPRVSYEFLPGFELMFVGTGVGVGVDLAVDPTNANKLYLVYHDTQSCQNPPEDKDVNIYMRTLTRENGDRWNIGDATLVADDDDLLNETDQFMPQIVVDSLGDLHVIFYSDVNYPSQTDGAANVKFDVWYAYSSNGGQDWSYRELCEYATNDCVGADPDPAIDSAVFDPPDNDWLRDYNGIAAGANDVWTSFIGISNDDTTTDKTLIWSSQITRQ